jgi:hypothetical protein
MLEIITVHTVLVPVVQLLPLVPVIQQTVIAPPVGISLLGGLALGYTLGFVEKGISKEKND